MTIADTQDACVIRSPRDIPRRAKRILVAPRAGKSVYGRLATYSGSIEGADGEPMHFTAGRHYIVEGPDGERSVVRRDIFEKTYKEVRLDRYRKRRDLHLHAAVSDREAEVHTLEGVQSAHPGDLIMIGLDGEVWPVPGETARRRYQPAHAMNWSAVEIGLMTAVVGGSLFALGAL